MRADGAPAVAGIPMSIVWWLVLTAVATWVLLRTRVGNWIFACGGDPNAARNVGVPVAAVKIGLFMFTASAATLFAAIQVLDAGSADTTRGLLKEFEAIIAAVIGGCLLTGGYGSAIGAVVRRADLRHRADGHLLHRREHRLVQGLPRRDDADRGAVQQLHPPQGHRSAMTVRRIVANLAADDPARARATSTGACSISRSSWTTAGS